MYACVCVCMCVCVCVGGGVRYHGQIHLIVMQISMQVGKTND